MEFALFALCAFVGVGLYFGVLRPIARFLFSPLTRRIPTGREYRASLTHGR